MINAQKMNSIIEIRSYNLKPDSGQKFHQLFEKEALPLLHKWGIKVVLNGFSQHYSNSYFLIRSFKNIEDRQKSEDAFYDSKEWKQGPRESILALIENYTTIVLPADSIQNLLSKLE